MESLTLLILIFRFKDHPKPSDGKPPCGFYFQEHYVVRYLRCLVIYRKFIYICSEKNCFKITKNSFYTHWLFFVYICITAIIQLVAYQCQYFPQTFSTFQLYDWSLWFFSFSFHSAEDFYEESDPAGSFGKMPFWRWCPAWSQHHVSEWNFNSIFTQLD